MNQQMCEAWMSVKAHDSMMMDFPGRVKAVLEHRLGLSPGAGKIEERFCTDPHLELRDPDTGESFGPQPPHYHLWMTT